MLSEYYGEIPKRYHRVAMKYSKLGTINNEGLLEFLTKNVSTWIAIIKTIF